MHPIAVQIRRGIVLSGLGVLASCSAGDSLLVPTRFEGVFVLADVNGVSLPADTPKDSDTGVGLITAVVADTLVFQADGLGHWSSVWHRRSLTGGGAVDTAHVRMRFRYLRFGEQLSLTFLVGCPACRDWFSNGVRAVSSGELRRSYYGSWRYTRIAAP